MQNPSAESPVSESVTKPETECTVLAAPVTVFRYPRPWLRRVVSRALALSLVIAVVALVAEIILVFVVGPLLCGIAGFTAILTIPLLMRTVLHPEIEIVGDGLRLSPMLWPPQTVRWGDLTGIIAHPLVYNDPAMGRTLHGK